MAISRTDLSSFINAMCTRNPNLGIPALEDGPFVNLLIFDYLYRPGSTRQGRVTGVEEGY